MLQSGPQIAGALPSRNRKGAGDRRAYPRIPSASLGITRITIRNRQAASLVDLSSGGALLELPYQLAPDSRVPMQFDAGGRKVELPIQLLRCYVASLNGGVRYHAAGAFDQLLNLDALTLRASTAMERMMAALERLESGVRKTALQSRSDELFHQTLTELISWLRQDESLDLVVLKLKARLTQSYRCLLIIPAKTPTFDPATTLECFGLTFKAKNPLSAHDRRFLKANAQLISILEATRRQLLGADARPRASQVVHSVADWQAAQTVSIAVAPAPRCAPTVLSVANVSLPVVNVSAKTPIVEKEEMDFFSALKIEPAFA